MTSIGTSSAYKIAEFSVSFRSISVSHSLFEQVGRVLLDTYAVGVAGFKEDASELSRRYAAQAQSQVGLIGTASLWGSDARFPIETAALLNGIAAHVLDYDDVTSPLRGHPSVALLPALLALGESLNASGEALARAYIVGFEVICKLAKSIGVNHYANGWHSTSSIGSLGAAVACAHLLELNAEQTVSAIGLSIAQAAGTRANFGAHAKAFQAGNANFSGLRAALLAKEGFTAGKDALESPIGYTALYGAGERLDLDELGVSPYELVRSGIEVKKYPLCYATHRALDGILQMRQMHELTIDDIARIEVETSKGAMAPLVHHRPTTGLQAKFSMEYAMASAILDGFVRLSSFTDDAVMRDRIQELIPLITSTEAESGSVLQRWANITVHRRDGTTVTKRIKQLRGSASAPLSMNELTEKAADCLDWAGSEICPATLRDACMSLANLSVREFLLSIRVEKTDRRA